MARFEPEDVILKPLGRGRLFELVEPLIYYPDGPYVAIAVPAGFVCDLNSIPFDGFGLGRKTDWPEPAIIHDWLYAKEIGTREGADELYRQGLVHVGCPPWRARLRYLALRAFGRRWKKEKGS